LFKEVQAEQEKIKEANKAISENFAQFKKLKESVAVDPARQQFFQQIDFALMIQQDLESMLFQGVNFYTRLKDILINMKQNVMDFKMSRQIQMEEVCKQLGIPPPDFSNNQSGADLSMKFGSLSMGGPAQFSYEME
jgi:hypothetical protein